MKRITASVLAVVISLVLFHPVFFSRWDQRARDLLTGWVGGGKSSDKVVIVQIDERSLARVGRWPWSRDRLATLVAAVRTAGADTVVLDMMFPEPDSAKPARSATQTNDDVLAESMRAGRIVTGFHFRFDPGPTRTSACTLRPLPMVVVERDAGDPRPYFQASHVLCSVPPITDASAGLGFLNASPERDGLLRRVPLITEYDGQVYPSLALAGYIAFQRVQDIRLVQDHFGTVNMRLDGNEFPVDSRAQLLLRFRGSAGSLRRVSAADVLAGSVPPNVFQGKVIVVGMSALGLQDAVATPVDPVFPGFEVHATALDNLLQRDPLSAPRLVLAGELFLLVVVAVGSGYLLARFDPLWAAPLVLLLVGAIWAGCAFLLAWAQILFSPFPSTLVLFGNLALLTLWRISTESRRAERQLEMTRRFILSALTSLSSIRDVETGAHVRRVQRYTKLLCDAMVRKRRFRRALSRGTIQMIYELVPIHDIGKVAIPDHILRKPGRLDDEEFEIMKTHTTHGYQVFVDAAQESGLKDDAALRLAGDIILAHHERWDGTGYPRGLRAYDIPLAGRIVAVADVYDAMVCRRVYKEPLSHETALDYISANAGRFFDPSVVEAFLEVEAEFHRTKVECEDDDEIRFSAPLKGPPSGSGSR